MNTKVWTLAWGVGIVAISLWGRPVNTQQEQLPPCIHPSDKIQKALWIRQDLNALEEIKTLQIRLNTLLHYNDFRILDVVQIHRVSGILEYRAAHLHDCPLRDGLESRFLPLKTLSYRLWLWDPNGNMDLLKEMEPLVQ